MAAWCWLLPLLPTLIDCQFYTGLGSTTYNQGGYRRSRYQKYYSNFRQNPLYQTSTTTRRPEVASLTSQYADKCGIRPSGYRPDQRQRQGRIIVPDSRSSGAAAPPAGSFPWLASLFLRRPSGEAYFMCAATLITPTVLVSAAHCFNEKWDDSSWYVRLGDNYIAKKDPSEQTFQVDLILRHQQFLPLSRPGGDGRNDIALLRIRPRKGRVIEFSSYVAPACLPKKSNRVSTFRGNHCEIAGWGMQEYNNTSSYPTSIRAAKIKVFSAMITSVVTKIVLKLSIPLYFHCSLAFALKGGHCAHQQVQLSLRTRCPQDGKILRRWKSRRLSGGFWRPPNVQTPWPIPSCWDNQQWKRVWGVSRTLYGSLALRPLD